MGCFRLVGWDYIPKVINHAPSEQHERTGHLGSITNHVATWCHAMAYLDLEIGCRLRFWGLSPASTRLYVLQFTRLYIPIWVCLKMGYPNYSHLIGIMTINHWV